MLLIPPLEQFIAGIVAASIFCSVLRWTPIASDLLIALAVAGMLNLLLADHNLPSVGDHDFIPLRIARELIGYPYFSLGVAIVTKVALFLMSRPVGAWGGLVNQWSVSRKLIVGQRGGEHDR
jgi:hypothetical protein